MHGILTTQLEPRRMSSFISKRYRVLTLRNATNNFGGPYPHSKDYFDNPSATQVDATPIERLREAIMGGNGGAIRRLCLYDENLVEKRVLRAPCCRQAQRMLIHHYFFLFFSVSLLFDVSKYIPV